MSSQSFADLGVSKSVVRALAARDIESPFPVQSLVIGDILAGRDVLVQSPTGSGKTLAFAVPMADRVQPGGRGPAALVLAPTRELAAQIVEESWSLTKARGLRIAAVYGGVAFGPQIRKVRKADVVVATPGRLEDLIDQGVLSLAQVRMLVLDEADRMLDMGFKPAVDRIVSGTPRDRQTLFFSATLEGAAGRAAAAYTRDPRRHTHAPKREDAGETTHRFVHLDSNADKLDALIAELRGEGRDRTLVFVRTKRGADRLVKRLRSRSVGAVAMHGDKSQSQRERALASFERGEVETLVATDVAARGIDVDDIDHVINYDAPGDSDAYVHRVGRTGRAGRDGAGTSFVLADQVSDVRKIAGDLGLRREFDGSSGPGLRAEGRARRRRSRRRRS